MRLDRNLLRRNSSRNAGALISAAAAIVLTGPAPAHAVDEIQVYNAEIAEVGQFTVQQHLNYTIIGRTQPEFPGGLVPNHALNGTPEFAWGVTPWLELGLYIPWAVNAEDQFLSNAFIVNPIVDLSFGTLGTFDFVPAARLARKLGDDFFVGVEYYTDLGAPGSFPPFQQQQHQVFGVVDFKVGDIDVDFGLGYGITSGSDRFVAKTILSYAFPVPGQAQADKSSLKVPLTTRAGTRALAADIPADPFLGMR